MRRGEREGERERRASVGDRDKEVKKQSEGETERRRHVLKENKRQRR